MHDRVQWDGSVQVSCSSEPIAVASRVQRSLSHTSAGSCLVRPPPCWSNAALPMPAQTVPSCRHWSVADVQGGWQRGGWGQQQPPRVSCSRHDSPEGGGSAPRGAHPAVPQPAGPAPQGAPLAGGSQVGACDMSRPAGGGVNGMAGQVNPRCTLPWPESPQGHSCQAVICLCACRGCLAAASDALGRVLLVDVASLTVIRVWKAYRNAQLAWLMLDVPAMEQHSVSTEADQAKHDADEEDKAEAGGNSTHHAALDAAGGPPPAQPRFVEHSDEKERQQQPLQQHGRKRKTISSPERPGAQPGMLRQQLCLVLYPKRLGVLEIWPMRYGSRLCSIRCGPDCCLVPNALPFGMQTRVGGGEPIPFGCQLLAMKSGVMQSVQELIKHDVDHTAA